MIKQEDVSVNSVAWKTKLFYELIVQALLEVGDVVKNRTELLKKNTLGELLGCALVMVRSSDPSSGEADAVRADVVEALALVGDLTFAEEVERSISEEGYDEACNARLAIIKSWAHKDPDRAMQMALNPIPKDPEIVGTEFEDLNEKEEQQEQGLREILGAITETARPEYIVRWITEVLPKYVQHQDDEYSPCLICRSQVILAEAMAYSGDIEGARKIATEQDIPCDQVATWLAVYKTSKAPEDLKAARAIAQEYDYEPHEQWIKIAEVTHDLPDIDCARASIAFIPVEDLSVGWSADFGRNSELINLAKISQNPNDIKVVREALMANPKTSSSLFKELCRITKDPDDFALMLNRAEDSFDRYSVLARKAEITRNESDFIIASKAVLDIKATSYCSAEYLRGISLAEIAQVLYGKPVHD